MAGLSQILEIARRAISSQRMGINVASHNIANASTPGFSRQRVNLTTTLPQKTSFGMLGTGVTASHVGRIRERFIDQQVRGTNNSMGESSAKYRILSQLEAAFNEPSASGLGAAMNRFFNSFQALSTHPEDSAARNGVIQQGLLLTQSFQRLRRSIMQMRDDLRSDIDIKVDRINQLTKEISQIDIEITNSIAVGLDPSDAKDQRDIRLEELSRLANVKVSEDERGSVMVSLGGAVIASRAGAVALQTSVTGDQVSVVASSSGKKVDVSSGELGGILTMHNSVLKDRLANVDQLASTLIARTNTVHAAGYGLGAPLSTGVSLFTGSDAQSIEINPAVANDTSMLAASGDGTPGNNQNALALAEVGNEPLLFGSTVSISQYYNGMVSALGTSVSAVNSDVRSQELIMTQLLSQRASVSGVSLDEEMVNMIKYQRAFEASARVVTSVDDLFKIIINMV